MIRLCSGTYIQDAHDPFGLPLWPEAGDGYKMRKVLGLVTARLRRTDSVESQRGQVKNQEELDAETFNAYNPHPSRIYQVYVKPEI